MDKASQVLARGVPPGSCRSFPALADHGNVARTTLQHRARGRRSIKEKAQSQQYLRPWEEKALVKFLIQQDALGRPVRIKYLGPIAFTLACRRQILSDRPRKAPGMNWPQSFYRRHSELKASKSTALDWKRYDIYNKVIHWFEVIRKVLEDPSILPENLYNMDETGVMLSKLNSVKVLVSKDNQHGYRGARVKRTTVTAIECVSGDGRCLNPMIIWPAATHRASWVTHPTPGWHYAYSDKGYTDSYLSLQWLKLVFDPQTRERANQKPRVLICDGFGTHETLEILEFCFENKIILCRIPSHTSHKLQPCDISVFGPLKAAYQDQVERLERGCVGTMGKEHFTYLYSPARDQALTSRNIRAGWAKAGLFPLNPDKVLCDISKPPADLITLQASEVNAGCCLQDQVPQTPVTPVSAEAVASLHKQIEQDLYELDEMNRPCLQKHIQKLTHAAQLSFAERTLLLENNQFLAQMNNKAKVRRSTKSEILGTARVMSYEDLENA
ncbi:hypothetical protein S40293_00203 [Stachybotrys chartarum IBT 40293]|nr:hypothetical protein S40293_00203 [Stachybotrys chartarum IBT 40293]